MKPVLSLLIAFVLWTAPLCAQADSLSVSAVGPPDPRPPGLRLDVPLLDAPYNIRHGLRAPSMQQSLALTEGFYEASHAGIQAAWGKHKWLGRGSVALWDYFTIALPLADAWVHEEFHRAVLGNRGIDSFNDVYKLDLSADAIAVSHVKDGDLVRLKSEHPAEPLRRRRVVGSHHPRVAERAEVVGREEGKGAGVAERPRRDPLAARLLPRADRLRRVPTLWIAPAVAKKVNGEVTTSSPGSMPSAQG